ncbi:MAG: fused MFS/spermidine synthase [Coriobacteriia bacterium]|nr:fused MFS/spermidine synthase [Coriobacteriia bacterium]
MLPMKRHVITLPLPGASPRCGQRTPRTGTVCDDTTGAASTALRSRDRGSHARDHRVRVRGLTHGLEFIAARLLAPALGSSLFVWGAVISIVMVALSLGYWSGGQIADRFGSTRTLAPSSLPQGSSPSSCRGSHRLCCRSWRTREPEPGRWWPQPSSSSCRRSFWPRTAGSTASSSSGASRTV